MNRKLCYLLGLVFFIFVFSCKDDKNKNETNQPFDPNKPITFSALLPDSGRIAEKLVITGDNFGNDKSIVKVFFKDINGKEVKAAVIGVDNQTIYCIVPRQENGINDVVIEIGDKSIVADKKFRYSVSENVSTIAGNYREGGHVDGNLADARFQHMYGIAIVGDETALVAQAWNGSGVRLVSVPDNEVVTVQAGIAIGQLIATKDKSRVYGIGIPPPHPIYVYDKNLAWAPMRVTEVGGERAPGDIWTCALDDTEEWLYFLNNGNFWRLNLADPSRFELLKRDCLPTPSLFSHLAYSKFEDCFYATVKDQNKILKVSKDGQTVDQINMNIIPGDTDGYLSDAQFRNMQGLVVDEDGNIFFVEEESAVIRKITLSDGYVKTVAGIANNPGDEDGPPKVAKFGRLSNIGYNGQGGFWVVSREGAGETIRKYAVE